jgi:PAS domain S-box-containing protein
MTHEHLRSSSDPSQDRDELFNLSLDMLCVAGFDGVLTQVNPAWTKCLGWSVEELTSGPMNRFILPEDVEATERVRQTIYSGQPVRGFQNRYRCRDGSFRWLSWNVYPVPSVRKVFAVARDVTEQKKTEAQLLRAQRMESIGTLAGGIAHDLNNVLTPILMSIDILKGKVADAEGRELLETVQQNVQRGADLVRQVLTFARGATGQRTHVNVGSVISDIGQVVREAFPKNIEAAIPPSRGLWTVVGDPTQLHQVLMNLCVNARDAMPSGGRLCVTGRNLVVDAGNAAAHPDVPPGAYVAVVVTDTGVGISDDIRDRIFEPFFTTKDVGQGTGLGLSTVMAIVASHGGTVAVASEPGVRTRFTVYLPATPAAATEAPRVPRAAPLPRGAGEGVLVVDDEEAIRGLARRILERSGYEVIVARDGAEATKLYAEHRDRIAVVLTDMAMPVMDGTATIAALRAIDPSVAIIGSSGHASDGALRHFVAKPYNAEALLTTVARALRDQAEGVGAEPGSIARERNDG